MPDLLLVDCDIRQPVAFDVANFGLNLTFKFIQLFWQLLIFPETRLLQSFISHFINDALERGPAARFAFAREEATGFISAKANDCTQFVFEVFPDNATFTFNSAISKNGAAQFPIRSIKANNRAIFKLKDVGSTKARGQWVLAHLANKLVVTMQFPQAFRVLH